MHEYKDTYPSLLSTCAHAPFGERERETDRERERETETETERERERRQKRQKGLTIYL